MNTNENTKVCSSCGCIIEDKDFIIPTEGEVVELEDGTVICADCARLLESGELVRCSDCGKFILKDDAIEYDGMFLCDDCKDARVLIQCEDCGEWFPEDELREVEAGWRRANYCLCESCIEKANERGRIFWCVDCETWNDSDRIDHYYLPDGDCICESCFENNDYCICADCGEIVRTWDASWDEEDEEWYCCDCSRHHRRPRRIHDYGFRPYPVFHGVSNPTYGDPITIGFELEVDKGDDRTGCAEELTDTFDEDTLYLKSDSSVDFEIVTHPHTLQAYMNELDIKTLCSIPGKYGYSSHNAGTCGLHCHVGRAQLGSDLYEKRKVIARIALLMYRHWDSLVKFSRRTSAQLSHWASAPDFSFEYGKKYDDTELELLVRRYYQSRGRYQALNLEPSNTIEFRLWRGTLAPRTLKATLQLTSNIVEYCMKNTFEQVVNSTWVEITGFNSYDELDEYLAERGLIEGMEAKSIPFGSRVQSAKEDYGFDVGDYVEIVNNDGELASEYTIGARGRVANFRRENDHDNHILILFDLEDNNSHSIAEEYGHLAGGLAPHGNGYWVYSQNIRLYPIAG